MSNKPTFGIKFLLFLLFFLGITLSSLVVIDAEFSHFLIKPPGSDESSDIKPLENSSHEAISVIDKLRRSIVLVECKDCKKPSEGNTGTGFVVKKDENTRYIATNAHVVRDGVDCDGIAIIDHSGTRYKTTAVGISHLEGYLNDLAILKVENIRDDSMPPLQLQDSTKFKTGHDGEKIISIGYPVLGVASTYDKASVSSEGNISQYDQSKNLFITSGLSVNKGNSGSPVFTVNDHLVLGIAVAKVDMKVAENVAVVIPIDRLKEFFIEKIGSSL